MNKIFSWMLTILLVLSSVLATPRVSNKNLTEPVVATRAADDLVALLPKSDVVAVIDVNRLVNDLLPKVKQAWPEQFAKFEKEFTEGIAKAKIDIYKVKSITIGMKLFGDNTSGAMIVDGVTLTPEMVADSTSTTYKGKTLYVEKPQPTVTQTPTKGKPAASAKANPTPKATTPPPSSIGVKGVPGVSEVKLSKDKTAFVQLEAERVAVGDEIEVKAILDALTGSSNPESNISNDLAAALRETTATGLFRFAVNIPDSVRQMASGEEFLKNLALTKMAMGTLDISENLSLLLDAKLRTGSPDDATKLHESLAALLGLGKMMLGGNQDPMMAMVNKLLDQIKLTPQATDVSLGVTVPRELYELFLKSETKAAPPKNDK
jgi:hypothetical protein